MGNADWAMWDSPQLISGIKAKQIAAGLGLTCAVNTDKEAVCWGSIADPAYDDKDKLLKEPEVRTWWTPTRVLEGLGSVAQVTVGGETACRKFDVKKCDTYVCGVSTDGNIACEGWWPGVNQTSNAVTWVDASSTPFAELSGDKNVLSAAAGDDHVCVLAGATVPSEAYCWGPSANHVGRDPSKGSGYNIAVVDEPSNYPEIGFDPPMKNSILIAAGTEHTCAVTEHGHVNCWGPSGNALGNKGAARGPESWRPVAVKDVDDAVQISAGETHTCITRGSRIRCWGSNNAGQLGDGTNSNSSNEPVNVPNLKDFIQVAAGSQHTCAIERSAPGAQSGTVLCWGDDSFGQLGDNEWRPTKVIGLVEQP